MGKEKLVIRINGDVSDYQKKLKQVKAETSDLESGLTSIAKNSAVAFAGFGLAIAGVVNEASKIETMSTQFEVLTGSVSEAATLMKDLQQFSASTPFQLEGIGKAAQQLLGFGFETEEVKKKLQEIGDVAAASGRPINEISLIFGQVAAAGKLTGERLLQFQERAIPIGPAIAKTMGIAESAVKKAVSEGKVDFATFEKAFASISEKGGKAFGGMEKQSKTLAGRISTLKDNFALFSADIGKVLLPLMGRLAIAATDAMQFLKAHPEVAKMTAKFLIFGGVLTGLVATVSTAVIVFLKLKVLFAAVGLAIGTLGAPIIAIGAALIGVAAIITDLALNWEKRIKMMQEVFTTFTKNIVRLGSSLGTILQGIFELDMGKIKDGLARAKDVIVESVEDVSDSVTADRDDEGNVVTKSLSPEPEIIKKKFEDAAEVTLEAREKKLGIDDENLEADLERQVLADELENNVELQKINTQIANADNKETKLGLIQDRRVFIDDKRAKIANKNKQLTDKQKLKMDHAVNKQLVDGAFEVAGALVAASGSSAKKQFIIQKTLGIAQILINGYMADALAQATMPGGTGIPVGKAMLLNSRISAGLVAATGAIEFAGMEKGGISMGGIKGVDSIPTMLQQGELTAPVQNFEEVIGSVRAKREADAINENGGGGGAHITVSYESEEASQLITVNQVEDDALGVSRDALREAI